MARHRNGKQRDRSSPGYLYDKVVPTAEDGAIFGFTGIGTNPDLLLLLDLKDDSTSQFSVAGMTAVAVTVRMTDKVMYAIPSGAGKGFVFDTWTYFLRAK